MTTWVLLRGLARESRHWGGFGDALRRAVPAGDDVLMLDLPGNGTRWRDRTPGSVERIAEAARDGLAQARVRGPVVLMALSLGGMVAVHWALRHPEEVRGCVLINSSMRGLAAPWERLRPGALAQLLLLLLPGQSAAARERRILRLTSNRPVEEAMVAAWAGHAGTAPVSRPNMLRQLLAAARFRAPSMPPAVPVLLLASRQDRLASVRCSRALARAWGVPLREHPAAGHDLALDDPDWVIAQVGAWTVTNPP